LSRRGGGGEIGSRIGDPRVQTIDGSGREGSQLPARRGGACVSHDASAPLVTDLVVLAGPGG
jgi:hypothetical protein